MDWMNSNVSDVSGHFSVWIPSVGLSFNGLTLLASPEDALQAHGEGLGGSLPAGRILMNETSTSEDASITLVQPSPEAYGTVIANTPPEKIGTVRSSL